jgi:hypothetical protein
MNALIHSGIRTLSRFVNIALYCSDCIAALRMNVRFALTSDVLDTIASDRIVVNDLL